MLRIFVAVPLLTVGAVFSSQTAKVRRPIIDMHVLGTNTSAADLIKRMQGLNIRYGWVASLALDLPE